MDGLTGGPEASNSAGFETNVPARIVTGLATPYFVSGILKMITKQDIQRNR
jgi:hypothetical protein